MSENPLLELAAERQVRLANEFQKAAAEMTAEKLIGAFQGAESDAPTQQRVALHEDIGGANERRLAGAECLEGLPSPRVVRIVLYEQREQRRRVDEDVAHSMARSR